LKNSSQQSYLCKKTHATLDKNILIYGFQPIMEAMNAGREIEKILILKTVHPSKSNEIKRLATSLKIPFQFVPIEKLNRLTPQNHQGLVAYTSPVAYAPIEEIVPRVFESGKTPFILILDKVTDVRNLGSIARTAECAGVDAILFPSQGSAMINADAIKTSAGALTKIDVSRVSNLKDAIRYLKESGISIIGATEKASQHYFEMDFKIPVAVIMGSEDKGISEEYLKLCDHKAKIQMVGEIQSLNVSVAAGIFLFEAVRQRLEGVVKI
jgi:23S rRNA (guanosine2251-2'-O)-methyltransferase